MNSLDSVLLAIQNFLIRHEVKDLIICAGARNAKIIDYLTSSKKFNCFHFFDERSASFFALGRSAFKFKNPVCVLTTSGTAVSECLSAVIEAHYNHLPLIILSADRPINYRKTGAPQSIEQLNIFSSYVEKCLDLDFSDTNGVGATLRNCDWSLQNPLHINLTMPDPNSSFSPSKNSILNLGEASFTNPLVIVGPLFSWQKNHCLDFLNRTDCFYFLESTSGLKNHPLLKNFNQVLFEKTAAKLLNDKKFDAIIRLGAVPTCRLWRDLEDKHSDLPVYSYSDTIFSGLARKSFHFANFAELSKLDFKLATDFNFSEFVKSENVNLENKFSTLCEKYPQSELALLFGLQTQTKDFPIYLGNSMPIREWDLLPDQFHKSYFFNRGANGIDGQISSFIGWASQFEITLPPIGIFGDLTALYDLNSPYVLSQLQKSNFKIVVINNFGAQIFRKMFADPKYYENSHELNFKNFASLWNLDYALIENIKNDFLKLSQIMTNNESCIIELKSDIKQTNSFFKDWDLT